MGSGSALTISHAPLAAHETGHAVARVHLDLGVGAITLREDGSGATDRVPGLNFTRLAEPTRGADGLTRLKRELIASHAGYAAEERWYTEVLALGPTLPVVVRRESDGDA